MGLLGGSLRGWLLSIMMLVNLAVSGCGMKVTMRPPFPEVVNAESVASKPTYSAVLVSTSATMDGKLTVMNSPFKDRLLQALRLLGAFSSVYGDDQPIPEKRKVKVSLNIAERLEYNNVLGAIKGFVIGASFFVLSPVIPIYADYTTELRLQVEKPDGRIRQYTGFASAESEPFFFSHGEYYADLTQQVTDAALRDLSAKLANDRMWLRR